MEIRIILGFLKGYFDKFVRIGDNPLNRNIIRNISIRIFRVVGNELFLNSPTISKTILIVNRKSMTMG